MDIDSLTCFVTPQSLDVLCGPVLRFATNKYRTKDEVVSCRLCQVTEDPMTFIPQNLKSTLITVLRANFKSIFANKNPQLVSKVRTPIAKRTLIRALCQITNKVWVVRHGLKDPDVKYLEKMIELVPNDHNRVDIGKFFLSDSV